MVEHRPLTTPRQHTRFWANLIGPVQLIPCSFISASVSRLQLLRGLPLFLLPCGFQVTVRAWRVVLALGFLRVCPIQPHFLRRICSCSHWLLSRSLPQIFILHKYILQVIITCSHYISCFSICYDLLRVLVQLRF